MNFADVLLKYGPAITIVITFVISLLKRDNTIIPPSVTPKTRAAIAAGLGVVFEVITSLDSGGGVVSTNPTVVAILAALLAFGIHGVKGNGVDDTTGKGSSVKPPPIIPDATASAGAGTTTAVVKDVA